MPARFAAQFLVSSSLLLLASNAAATVRIWVDDSWQASTILKSDCTQPGAGDSPTDPIRDPGGPKGSGLADAIICANSAPWLSTQDVEIVVECSMPGADGYCHYLNQPSGSIQNPKETVFDTTYSLGHLRTVHSQYPNSVKLDSPMSLSVGGSHWTFENLIIDGNGREEDGSFIFVSGSYNTLRGNIIGNSEGDCILVNAPGDANNPPTDSSPVPDHITIENNIIRGCYDLHTGGKDDWNVSEHSKEPLCIHNHLATNLIIQDNDISDCAADAYQTEMYEPGSGETPATTSHFAQNTTITGNRIWANQYQVHDGGYDSDAGTGALTLDDLGADGERDWDAGQPRTMGENAIDIKKSGEGLHISDNVIWGYRASRYTSLATAADFAGTGGGDPAGGAIVLHGDFVQDADGGYTCPTDGTSNHICALVEGNDISDCGGGVSVGYDSNIGNPTGVTVRGNRIHDLRNMGFDKATDDGIVLAYNRGVGLFLSAGDTDGGTTYRNRVYRNTVANIPGALIRTDLAVANTDVENNLFVNSAAHDSPENVDVDGGQNCKLDSRGGLLSLAYNAFLDTRSGDNQGLYATDGGTVKEDGTAGLDFVAPSNVPVTPYDATSNPTGQLCGAIENRERQGTTPLASDDAAPHLDPATQYSPLTRLDYDRKNADSSSSVSSDTGPNNTAPFNIASSAVAVCGSGPEFGAGEICADQTLWVRKSLSEADDSSTDHPEPLPAGWAWWSSPDVGFVPAGRITPDISRPLTLWSAEPDWNQTPRGGSFVVRAGYNPGFFLCYQPPPTARIQVFGAPAGTASIFPRDYTKVADQNVRLCNSCDQIGFWWNGVFYGCTGFACCDGQPGWHLVKDSTDGDTYSFALDAPSDYESGYGSLRTVVSMPGDPTPSVFTPPMSSNNVAQLNDLTSRFPLAHFAVSFNVEGDVPRDSASHARPRTTTLNIDNTSAHTAYLYVPPGNSALWQDVGTPPPTFPPPGAIAIAPQSSAQPPPTVSLPDAGPKTVQLLVDGTNTNVVQGEHVDVTESDGNSGTKGGVSVTLLQSGPTLQESFENGLPSNWITGQGGLDFRGLWHVVDQYIGACGAADTGRKAMAFNRADTCDYACQGNQANVSGMIETPYVSFGPTSKLSFSEWAATEQDPGWDVRTVTLYRSPDPSTPLKAPDSYVLGQWSGAGSNVGGNDDWRTRTFDLSSYYIQGRTISIKFEFESGDCYYNNYAGWYLDDVEIW